MALVRVQKKGQVTLPVKLRAQVGLADGDVVEALVRRGEIILKPKSLVDRGIAQSLEEFKNGRFYGPFDTAEEMIASLHAGVKRIRARKRKASRRLR